GVVRVTQHHLFDLTRVVEGVADAFLLHEALRELEMALLVLQAVLAAWVALTQLEPHAPPMLGQRVAEDRLEDLGGGLLLEDPCVAVKREHPQGRDDVQSRPRRAQRRFSLPHRADQPAYPALDRAAREDERRIMSEQGAHLDVGSVDRNL